MGQLERKVTVKSNSFLDEKGADDLGLRIGDLKEMEGTQGSTFPLFPFHLRSW